MLWCGTAKPEVLDEMYEAPAPETRLLKAGWRLTPEHAPFVVDTIWDKDIQVALRDGVKIRADIFRPEESGKVPVLIAWSPYGKSACRPGGIKIDRAYDSLYTGMLLISPLRFQRPEHDPWPGQYLKAGSPALRSSKRLILQNGQVAGTR